MDVSASRLLSAMIVLVALSVCATAGEVRRRNVLFIICDDLNCDLGCYGHPVSTPNIDKLALRGVRFEHAYCQYPLCGPSRASFMTGLYPPQTGILRNGVRLREALPDVVSISQMFIQEGYQAARVGKVYHYNVPRDIGTDGHDDPESWTHRVNPKGRAKAEESKVFSLIPGRFGGTLSWMAADGTDEQQTDGIAATESVKLLRGYAMNRTPFFLAVGLFRPHTPLVAPRKYFDLYPTERIRIPSVPQGYRDSLPAPAAKSVSRQKEQLDLSADLARQAIQAYRASISFADAQVGRILDALQKTGLEKNTVVILTSDHGYHMGEHGWWQKTTLFENADRIPLIISAPGMKARGKTTGSIAEMIDFYPTLAELCQLKAPEYLPGVSLVSVLDDPAATPRKDALTQYAGGHSLRTKYYRYNEWGPGGRDGAELYAHRTDPKEMHNLIHTADRALIEALAQRLHQRIVQASTVPAGLTRNQSDGQTSPNFRRGPRLSGVSLRSQSQNAPLTVRPRGRPKKE